MMNVFYPTQITVVCMPTAPITLEVMSVPVQKALQEMDLHVMVGVENITCLYTLKHYNFNADVDECSDQYSFPCHSEAFCNNTFGSFTCTCLTGYSGDGMTCNGKSIH